MLPGSGPRRGSGPGLAVPSVVLAGKGVALGVAVAVPLPLDAVVDIIPASSAANGSRRGTGARGATALVCVGLALATTNNQA